MRSMFAVVTAAAISAGLLAGPAALATATPPGTIQVTGTQLASALLPISAFGSGYVRFPVLDSGRSLGRPAYPDVGAVSCPLYSVLLGESDLPGDPGYGFGATANATEEDLGGGRTYRQSVYQFASQRAAAALFAQTYAKYANCRSFAFSGVRVRLESESKTRVGGYQAFLVRLLVSYPGAVSAPPPYPEEALFAIDGDEAFVMNVGTRTAGAPLSTTLAALTVRLIDRARALR